MNKHQDQIKNNSIDETPEQAQTTGKPLQRQQTQSQTTTQVTTTGRVTASKPTGVLNKPLGGGAVSASNNATVLSQIAQNLKTSHRISNDLQAVLASICENLAYIKGRFPPVATMSDYYQALAYTIKDRLMSRWALTASTYYKKASRTICYFSAEFLIGPQLEKNILNLGLMEVVKEALALLQLDFNTIVEQEPEPGLGNGGLGRLAACYMDSLATLNVPAIGYGIRYEFGIFEQRISNGWQSEITDKWLSYGNPWEIARPDVDIVVGFGGKTEAYTDDDGRYRVRWLPAERVRSIPYDTPIIGFQATTTNFIRLWCAEACEAFDFNSFNAGDYYKAVQEKMESENITKVLYPNDESLSGKVLRLKQQYFFVSSSLQDMIRIYRQRGSFMGGLCEKYAIQLNDTHPAIGIAELMRLLVDVYQLDWDSSWEVTQKCFSYTNHTLLPEALECWSLPLFAQLLPRHLEIIYEINFRFLSSLPPVMSSDLAKVRKLSIIDETGERKIRMANLACIGSHAINGVSQLHSELIKHQLLPEFYQLWPEKFTNVTNGVTPRRFLMVANPELVELINQQIGCGWQAGNSLQQLRELEPLAQDPAFIEQWQAVKLHNKRRLAKLIKERTGITVDPQSLFDVHAKRIHEYKRQHLKLLHVVAMYNRIRNDLSQEVVPRTVIFAGKAAPGYYIAKLIIKLINDVATVINNDPLMHNRLKVVFFPNFNVKNAHTIYSGAELSEQISTAGMEASGTGNMKFALNGALTIGTLDGANVEIRQEVGAEHFFLFGMDTQEVQQLRAHYQPRDYINQDPELLEVMKLLASPLFLRESALFQPLLDNLWNCDPYCVMADFRSYMEAQERVEALYRQPTQWNRSAIYNVARIGKFSSDRAISEYCQQIWRAEPVQI